MKLLEFITYCTVKGIVIDHEKLKTGQPVVNKCEFYKIHVQARSYSVVIEYARIDNHTKIIESSLRDYSRRKGTQYNPKLKIIVDAIIPS